jgi:hypothetical protein
MLSALGWVHALLLRACLWVLKLPFQALAGTIKAMVALVGEEGRRWLSVLVSGLLIYLLAKGVLVFPHPPKVALWIVALMAALWFYAVLRAAHYTVTNNLIRVRQRQMFRELSGNVRDLRGDLAEGMAKATRGTPLDRLFDRDHRAKVEADARAAEARQAA